MKRKILIIDDETDFCMIMKGYFMKKDYEVSLAYTLKEGLALLKETKPDILFLDNNLPDGDGWDVLDTIVEITPQIRVYLISAHRNKSTVNQQPGRNIVAWEKPISMQILNSIF
ncbi:MAG: response regulator [Chitinophagaceae bacterium]